MSHWIKMIQLYAFYKRYASVLKTQMSSKSKDGRRYTMQIITQTVTVGEL